MRVLFAVIFFFLIAALIVCTTLAKHSKKAIGKDVVFLCAGLIPPILGNLLILITSNELLATIGFYLYFLGLDLCVFAILKFAYEYCEMKPPKWLEFFIYFLLGIDLIQYIANPFLKFTFTTAAEMIDGRVYYVSVPYTGQQVHRVIAYSIFIMSLVIFLIKALRSPRIYAEKYWIIWVTEFGAGLLETYYIFSRAIPYDISMFAFGLFGLLAYYFSLQYRPMKLLDKMLSGIASEMPEALYFFDTTGKCVWMNEPGRHMIGTLQDTYDDVKENLSFLFGDIDFDNNDWNKKVILGTGDEAQYTHLTMRPVVDENGKYRGSYLSIRDVTEEQNEIKREIYNSTHDSVTGLYTKEYLYECIEKRLKNDKETDYMIGYMEISNYKVINDVFGRRFGELTVKKASEFIREGATGKSIYGRLSEDSFGILIDKEDFMGKPVEEKLAAFTVRDKELEHHVLIHYGVYDITKDDPIDVPTFFDSARLATTRITDIYSTHLAYYDDKIRSEIIHDQLISNQLNDAIATRQIRPYLQPIVDGLGLLVGAEALVRWIHPDDGMKSPGSFIPVFERNGLIAEVDKYMWRCACEILSSWKARGITQFISINISPKDFYFMDVAQVLKDLIKEFDIDPKKLRIEITETVMMTDAPDRMKIIASLRESGFVIEMDDFGSGYSSLSLLKDMPVDVLKIDMQFLKDSERNMKAGMIIKNIISMSSDLGMDTLTEGVETAQQFEKLYAMGCKLYQGYYFSKPVPVEEFERQWFD